MTERKYTHRVHYDLRLAPGGDDRAPGGAVTVALCGHWDHEGPCRWPHHSAIQPGDGGFHRLVVSFDAPADDVEEVKARIAQALHQGELVGPDGRRTVWSVES